VEVLMRILAIDPGTTQSGWCIFVAAQIDSRILECGIWDNQNLVEAMEAKMGREAVEKMAIEVFEARGMPIGKDSIETILWTGQFIREWEALGGEVMRVHRSRVKILLCGTVRAKDPNIRQALIDKLGPQGTKKNPGPTYGVKSHIWAALAVAVTAQETTK
jgi:hypothetical protein